MKKTLLILLTVIASTLNVAAEAYYYNKYNVDMQVHKNGTYTITETLHATFTEPRHGIVRDWPTSVYLKRLLQNGDELVEKVMQYDVKIGNFNVSESYELMTEDGFGIRIGSADKTIEGEHTYIIRYDYTTPNDRTATGDLLFFSLLGANHETNTEEFNFAVHFDEKVPLDSLSKVKIFFGNIGNEDNRAGDYLTQLSDTLITGTVRNLNAHEAVSIYLALPEGYFTYADGDGYYTFYVWGCCALCFALCILCLVRIMKPRNNYTMVVECWPPKDLSSADIGYIYDTTVDPRDIISLIPYFANQGLLTIDTTSGHPVLKKKADIDDKAPRYQKKFFNALFSDGNTFDTEKPSSKFADCWLSMDKEVKKANKGMTNNYSPYLVLIPFAFMAAFAATGFADVTNCGMLLLFSFLVLLILSGICVTSLFLWDQARKFYQKALMIAWFAFLIGLFWAFNFIAMSSDEVFISPFASFALPFAFMPLLVVCLLAFRMVSMSKKRLERIGQIVGLKEFIEKSEKPMLDQLSKEHEHYFYDILPYAVAFNLAEKWAKQFNGLDIKQPDWYTGNDSSMNNFMTMMAVNHLMSRSMNRSVQELQSARMAEQSKSSASSFGGGGFAGGGFGGGGSHSW